MTVIEKLAGAVHSRDLSHKTVRCDVDYLQALAIASRRNMLGSALVDLELQKNSRVAGKALNAVMEVVRALAQKHGWAATPVKCRQIAVDALNVYLRPVCPCCKGRGMTGIEVDKPGEYKPRPCSTCGGNGLKDIPRRNQREVKHALYVIQRARDAVEGKAQEILKN